jgi:predicted metal-binding protein
LKIELVKYRTDSDRTYYYERYETTMAVSDFEYGQEFKRYCQECSNYQKNLSCPPYSPYFPDYVGESTRARVICLRIPLAYYNQPTILESCDACFLEMKGVLESELLDYRKQGLIIAGSGACLNCKRCAIVKGREVCKRPEKQIYSLESLGVNIASLMTQCFNISLEWSSEQQAANFICVVGAVFFDKDSPPIENG